MSKKIVDVAPLMEYYRNKLFEEGNNPALEDALERLRELKDVESKEVCVCGCWEVNGIDPVSNVVGNWKCSVCHKVSLKDSAFCPNCGARMEEEE
jgi:hypothetical protein|nr:MAG TPA: RNA-binding protein [Caudoviricetes sp.]